MPAANLITKSEFTRGIDCVRRPWLDRYRPDLKEPLDLSAKDRIAIGMDVGQLGRARYPGGLLLQAGREAAQRTQEEILDGAETLFEATFEGGGKLARVDVLTKGSSGWVIEEVKSSTLKVPNKIDKDKILDIAFQYQAVRQSGLPLTAARLALIDSSYTWDGGIIDPQVFLGSVDVTKECNSLAADVDNIVDQVRHALQGTHQPEVELNVHCKKCEYFDFCHEATPPTSIIYLPRITAKQVRHLRECGSETIQDLPETIKLTATQERMVQVVKSGQPFVGEGLRDALAQITFPAAFLDFETSAPGIPGYPGTRPYQPICFQWSLHVLQSTDAPAQHFEFLAATNKDPREEFCRTLLDALQGCDTVVHYSAFELTQLKSMVKDHVPNAQALLDWVQPRAVDLLSIVSDQLYLEEFRGQTSIKVVLPALCPELSYDGMAIKGGDVASAAFRKMVSATTPEDEATQLRHDLLVYCELDTRAMVEVFRALTALASEVL